MDPETDHTKRVLILCTGNSCRSQMAEALWPLLGGDAWEVNSAGTRPASHVHPLAIEAMAERGIDISSHRPKPLDSFVGEPFDLVVTVCSGADAVCPTFDGAKLRLHWPFDDPATAAGSDEQRMELCRRVRDEIEQTIKDWLATARQ